MSTVPAKDVPDSLQPPAYVAEPASGVPPTRPRFGIALPWAGLQTGRRTLLQWTIAFALLTALPFIDSNGGDLDAFANAGTYVLLALGLNVVVGFCGLLDLGYAAFFALGAYAYGLAASFQLKIPWSVLWVPFQWLGQVDQVQFGGGPVDAAAARRLPGDRDARLRRDRANRVTQREHGHQRCAGPARCADAIDLWH